MQTHLARLVITLLAALAALLPARPASAQDYPARTVSVIVPFAAGGATDVVARLVSEKLGERLRANFVVENKAGAAGAIGAKAVIAAPADGHTILFGTAGTQAVSPSFNPKTSFDPRADLAPVARIGVTPNLLTIHPSIPAKTVAEFIAYAKAQPTPLNFGNSGLGTLSHLNTVLFARTAGINLTSVPYRGAGPASNDVVSGVLNGMFETPVTLGPLAEAGSLRALATTGATRLSNWPAIPTLAEQGFPGLVSELWIGVFAPKATPAATVKILEDTIAKVLAEPAIIERMRQLGFEASFKTATGMAEVLDADLVRWSTLIKDANLKAE